ncbi:extensin family protein [Xanthobacter sp. DSM 24535]|uniref:extensin-like domain-containing protein n=1 Tax=Roseixanthobacter psychrophilus TaxID=3119917 RepID=UPI00372AFF14
MFDRREPWRAEAEEKCIAEKGVVPSVYMEPMSAIDGAGACGMDHPFRVSGLEDGSVAVEPKATLACPMIRDLNLWLAEVVQPAAMAWLGQPVVGIRQMSSYSCRGMNGQVGAKISEHAFGNALDVGGFTFADGREISVKNGWRGPQEARGFLLQVQAGACEVFTTVLAPGSNVFHYDHIHVDLMRRNNPRLICKPAPRPMTPPAPVFVTIPKTESQLGVQPYGGPQPALQGQQVPGTGQPGEPMSISPQGAQPLPERAPAGYGQSQPAGYGQMPARAQQPYGAPPPGYPPSGDPVQRVLPPGGVYQPNTLRPPGPMSYGPVGTGDPQVTGSVANRKYYSPTYPQASPIPLPQARPGED